MGSLIFYLSSYFNQQIVEEDSEDLIGSTEEVTKNKITESSLRRAESIVMVHINSKQAACFNKKSVQAPRCDIAFSETITDDPLTHSLG